MTGWPQTTILRGEVVMRDGEILGRKGSGAFLRRDRSPAARRQAGALA